MHSLDKVPVPYYRLTLHYAFPMHFGNSGRGYLAKFDSPSHFGLMMKHRLLSIYVVAL